MWMVVNNALLINHSRMHKGMALTNVCAFCLSHSETVLNVLRDCDLAKNLWMSIDNRLTHGSFFQLPLQQWVEDIIKSKSRSLYGVLWPLLFATECSSLWFSGNLFIFEGECLGHFF